MMSPSFAPDTYCDSSCSASWRGSSCPGVSSSRLLLRKEFVASADWPRSVCSERSGRLYAPGSPAGCFSVDPNMVKSCNSL
jgi:hypothetical protein